MNHYAFGFLMGVLFRLPAVHDVGLFRCSWLQEVSTMACKAWPGCPCGSQDDCARKKERHRRDDIILAAARHVAAWPQWKRDQFEAFSKRNFE